MDKSDIFLIISSFVLVAFSSVLIMSANEILYTIIQLKF